VKVLTTVKYVRNNNGSGTIILVKVAFCVEKMFQLRKDAFHAILAFAINVNHLSTTQFAILGK